MSACAAADERDTMLASEPDRPAPDSTELQTGVTINATQ